jgi:hypothetical protein
MFKKKQSPLDILSENAASKGVPPMPLTMPPLRKTLDPPKSEPAAKPAEINAALDKIYDDFQKSIDDISSFLAVIDKKIEGVEGRVGALEKTGVPSETPDKSSVAKKLDTLEKLLFTSHTADVSCAAYATFLFTLEVQAATNDVSTTCGVLVEEFGRRLTITFLFATSRALKSVNRPELATLVADLLKIFSKKEKKDVRSGAGRNDADDAEIDEEDEEEPEEKPEDKKADAKPARPPRPPRPSRAAIAKKRSIESPAPDSPPDKAAEPPPKTVPATHPEIPGAMPISAGGLPAAKFCDTCGAKIEEGLPHNCILAEGKAPDPAAVVPPPVIAGIAGPVTAPSDESKKSPDISDEKTDKKSRRK